MKPCTFLAVSTLMALLFSSCGLPFIAPTPTPLPTSTPTFTPTPTLTPTPTFTSTPSFTPTPNGQVVELLGMRLLVPLDWQVEVEEEDAQINADIKEPDSGVNFQFMSIAMDEMDDPGQCSMDYMQPLIQGVFEQMIKGLKPEEMDDMILQSGTVMPRSALVGKFMELFTFRIEVGVLSYNEVCYTVFLSGEESALTDNQDIINEIYQSIEFHE